MSGSRVIELHQALLGVLVTEKSTQQRSDLNQFTFRVPVAATKTVISEAVFEAFGVRPVSVATQRYKEVARRYKFHRGYGAEWKKAIVTIAANETLPV
jgi:large subunit ribosomal protein L23